jgi:hypothetical protein
LNQPDLTGFDAVRLSGAQKTLQVLDAKACSLGGRFESD